MLVYTTRIMLYMTDIFDAKIICKHCNKEMKSGIAHRNGMELRAMVCPSCKDTILHPADLQCLTRFNDLKGKTFNVKLRMVGNSHAVSIPKEIVDFMNEQKGLHETHRRMSRAMDDMVKLCFDDFRRISLRFDTFSNFEDEDALEGDIEDEVEDR